MPRSVLQSLLLLLTLVLWACQAAPPTDNGATTDAPTTEGAPPPEPGPATPEPSLESDHSPTPSVASTPRATSDGEVQRMAARHILVAHETAERRPMHVHRTASTARKKAEELAARIAAGEDFIAIAKRQSDCSTASRGGFLGGFDQGTMAPAFEAAALALEVGEVSGIVETPFGYHIIKREVLEEIRVAQILFTYAGAKRDKTGRNKAEARALAQQARDRLDAGEDFAAVARALSDGAAGLRGGDLGWFTRGQFMPDWEQHAFALDPGDVSGPFETDAGVHVIRRLE